VQLPAGRDCGIYVFVPPAFCAPRYDALHAYAIFARRNKGPHYRCQELAYMRRLACHTLYSGLALFQITLVLRLYLLTAFTLSSQYVRPPFVEGFAFCWLVAAVQA
jgi:hypothetical protein